MKKASEGERKNGMSVQKKSPFDYVDVVASGTINRLKEIIGQFHEKHFLRIFKKNKTIWFCFKKRFKGLFRW